MKSNSTRFCYRFHPVNTFISLLVLSLCSFPVAADRAEANTVVQEAAQTVEHFIADPDMTWLRDHFKEAKGVLIVPNLIKAGFVFGGSGGKGILVVRNPKTGGWSEPAFYTVGSVSWGLQIGVKKSEVMMVIRTDQGVEALYASSFKLGGEAGVAAGPVGASAEGATSANLNAEYLSFARSKGAFAGLSLEGAILKTNEALNQSYHNHSKSTREIVSLTKASNPASVALRKALRQLDFVSKKRQ